MSRLFIGSALSTIGNNGMLILPDAFCITITSRGANAELYIRRDEDLNCLVVYDDLVVTGEVERFERRRIAEGGIAPTPQLERLRNSLGFTAPARLDGKGRVSIAPWLDTRQGEAHRALIIGMGHSFEIWDVDYVMKHEYSEMRKIAMLHLDLLTAKKVREDRHELDLQLLGPRSSARIAHESGFPVQPL